MWTFELDWHPDILSFGSQPAKSESQSVCAELIDDINRIDAVAFTLGHRFAIAIEYLWVNEDLVERYLPKLFRPIKTIRATQRVIMSREVINVLVGIEILQLISLFWPA